MILKNNYWLAEKDLENNTLINSLLTYRKTIFVVATFVFLSPDISCQQLFPGSVRNDSSPVVDDSLNYKKEKQIDSVETDKAYHFMLDDTFRLRTDQFYDTLRNRARKRRITREILDLIVTRSSSDTGKIAMVSETPFIEYDDKIIRSIIFRQLDVFGTSVEDTTRHAKRLYEKTGNKLHIHTSENILRKNLLVRPGERLDAYTLADNERIIRALPYIHDVKFLVKTVDQSPDSVDIIVLTKDLWATGFGLEISDIGKGRLAIWNRNMFGSGHEDQNTFFWDDEEKPLIGYEEIYRINNIAGSFINSEFRFKIKHGTQQYLADFQRSFFTPDIKYAGGLHFENKNTAEDIELIDTTLIKIPYTVSNYDFWIGRSYHLKQDRLFFRERSNLMIAGRIFSVYYHDRPEVSEDYLYLFHNRIQFIGSAAISNQGFYKSRLVYRFGKTEDIPYGYLVQLTGGFEVNEFKNRPYLGISASNGIYLKKRGGYFYNKFEMGGFFENGSVEQGTIGLTTKYFTPLFSYNRYHVRYFLSFNYKTGIHRSREEYITLKNNEVLEGLKSDMLKGIQRMTLHFETVSFTPYYLIGFRFVLFGFVDLGLIGPGGRMIFDNTLYSGIGMGIRLRNERLVFNTLQIRLAFYPYPPEDSEWYFIQASGEEQLKMEQFYISDPKFIEY
ncbi:MAG: hypothetical protein JW723_14820 [Bacteroidales bacterium]|nr:hypothetical protein [Bacteroidales bacterium]